MPLRVECRWPAETAFAVSRSCQARTIGREAEFPVVNADGTAADVRRLLARMDEAGDLKLKQVGDHGLYGDEYEYRSVSNYISVVCSIF